MATPTVTFESLALGARVVFAEDAGMSGNVTYLFGVVAPGPSKRAKKRFQLVETETETLVADGINFRYRVVPRWDRLVPGQVYPVARGRGQYNLGEEYLRDGKQWPAGPSMSFVPTFKGVFDTQKDYTNIADSP